MSTELNTVQQCQYQNSRGQRCHMLIDTTHRLPNGVHRPTLCAYHADRLKASVDPEVLAAELLTDIDSFTTADEVTSSSAISSGNSLASASPAVTPSLWPTSRNSSSPAKPPWPGNEQATNRRARTKRCSIAS